MTTTESTAGAASVDTTSQRRAEFDRYFATRTHFGNLAFSADGTQLAYIVNTSGQLNVWRQMVGGGWAWQVTTFEDTSARVLLWTPGDQIIGIADRQGSEQYQLFSVPVGGGVLRYLTDRPDVQYQLSEEGLSPDGRLLAFAANDRDPADSDVLLLDLQSGETKRLLANGHANYAINWSPDGRWIAAVDIRSNTDLHLWLIEVASGEAEELLPHGGEEFVLMPGPWLPDSSGFYVTTNRGREFEGVARYTLESRSLEWVLAPDWDVEHLAASRDGRRLVWTLNVDGRSELYVRDEGGRSAASAGSATSDPDGSSSADEGSVASDGELAADVPLATTLRVGGLPLGVIEQLSLSPDGRTAALRINAATAPADIYTIRFAEPGADEPPYLRRLTFGMLGGLAPEDLVAPELIHFRAHDGRHIPAWLYRPRSASDGGEQAPAATPVVLSIHGGPESQERVEYHAFYQYLLARGIAVLAPNIRGSTGYGVAYQRLIHRDWGGAELGDVQAAAEWVKAQPWASGPSAADGARLGIYGGSFGGFVALSAVTRLPDYWAAAVDIVGPSNLLTFVRSVPPTWRRMLAAWIGDPEADADFLRERSPIAYVEQVRAPLLIMQGAHDPRVVKAESDQMVERLRGLGREVEYVVFEDEGHGFTKRANQMRAYWLAAAFFERHLLAGRLADEPTPGA